MLKFKVTRYSDNEIVYREDGTTTEMHIFSNLDAEMLNNNIEIFEGATLELHPPLYDNDVFRSLHVVMKFDCDIDDVTFKLNKKSSSMIEVDSSNYFNNILPSVITEYKLNKLELI